MTTRQRHLEILVLGYTANLVAERMVNIAALGIERQGGRIGFSDVRSVNLDELASLYEDVDVELLKAFLDDVEIRLKSSESTEELIQMILDQFSNTIQVSERQVVLLSGDAKAEFDKLARLYLS
jgi:hypothetical protein